MFDVTKAEQKRLLSLVKRLRELGFESLSDAETWLKGLGTKADELGREVEELLGGLNNCQGA